MAEKNLYERLGGVNAIAMVVDRFSDEIVKNPKLNLNPAPGVEQEGPVAGPQVHADSLGLPRKWRSLSVYR